MKLSGLSNGTSPTSSQDSNQLLPPINPTTPITTTTTSTTSNAKKTIPNNFLSEALVRIQQEEDLYADDELNLIIENQLPQNTSFIPAALSSATGREIENDKSEEFETAANSETPTPFHQALSSFRNSGQNQLVAPIHNNNHFTGLHVTRNSNNSFHATYINPIGASQVEPTRLESGINFIANWFGLGKPATKFQEEIFGREIPPHIIDALRTELGIQPTEITITRNRLQHSIYDNRLSQVLGLRIATNNHCGAFTAETLVALAHGEMAVSGNRLTERNPENPTDFRDVPDHTQSLSQLTGFFLRQHHAQILREILPEQAAQIDADEAREIEQKKSKENLWKQKDKKAKAKSVLKDGVLSRETIAEEASDGIPAPRKRQTFTNANFARLAFLAIGSQRFLARASQFKPDELIKRPTLAPVAAPTVSVPTLAPITPTVASTSALPSATPTVLPSFSPTMVPSVPPTTPPTLVPTLVPTPAPSSDPSATPTLFPTFVPTLVPSADPTAAPTVVMTQAPSNYPTTAPSFALTFSPSGQPTFVPTTGPTVNPTDLPTIIPSADPSVAPTIIPSASPTALPSEGYTANSTSTQTSSALFSREALAAMGGITTSVLGEGAIASAVDFASLSAAAYIAPANLALAAGGGVFAVTTGVGAAIGAGIGSSFEPTSTNNSITSNSRRYLRGSDPTDTSADNSKSHLSPTKQGAEIGALAGAAIGVGIGAEHYLRKPKKAYITISAFLALAVRGKTKNNEEFEKLHESWLALLPEKTPHLRHALLPAHSTFNPPIANPEAARLKQKLINALLILWHGDEDPTSRLQRVTTAVEKCNLTNIRDKILTNTDVVEESAVSLRDRIDSQLGRENNILLLDDSCNEYRLLNRAIGVIEDELGGNQQNDVHPSANALPVQVGVPQEEITDAAKVSDSDLGEIMDSDDEENDPDQINLSIIGDNPTTSSSAQNNLLPARGSLMPRVYRFTNRNNSRLKAVLPGKPLSTTIVKSEDEKNDDTNTISEIFGQNTDRVIHPILPYPTPTDLNTASFEKTLPQERDYDEDSDSSVDLFLTSSNPTDYTPQPLPPTDQKPDPTSWPTDLRSLPDSTKAIALKWIGIAKDSLAKKELAEQQLTSSAAVFTTPLAASESLPLPPARKPVSTAAVARFDDTRPTSNALNQTSSNTLPNAGASNTPTSTGRHVNPLTATSRGIIPDNTDSSDSDSNVSVRTLRRKYRTKKADLKKAQENFETDKKDFAHQQQRQIKEMDEDFRQLHQQQLELREREKLFEAHREQQHKEFEAQREKNLEKIEENLLRIRNEKLDLQKAQKTFEEQKQKQRAILDKDLDLLREQEFIVQKDREVLEEERKNIKSNQQKAKDDLHRESQELAANLLKDLEKRESALTKRE